MKKRSAWLVLFLWITCSSVQAQGELQGQFNQIIDLINCRVAGISLADQDGGEAPFLPAFEEFFDCAGGDQNNTDLRSFLEARELNLTLALNAKIDSFKLRFDSLATTGALRSMIETQLLDQELSLFEEKHALPFGQMRTDILPILDAFLPETAASNPETLDKPKPLGKKTDPGKSNPNTLLFILLLVVLIGVIAYLYYRLMQNQTRQTVNTSNPNPQFEIENMQNYDQDIRRLKEDNHQLRSEIDLLKEQIRLIHEELAKLQSKATEQPEPPHKIDRPVDHPIDQLPVRRTFYMRTPHPDGFFNNQSKSDHFRPFESVYEFEMDPNDSAAANFHLVSDQDTQTQAIQTFNRYIEPVCESEEPFNPKATRIVTIAPGKAVLKGDRWEVAQKAMIRYE